MGGLSSVLGGLATGYTQAAQVDRQRQFEDSQARRSQMVTLLGKLAADETVHPEIRQWATQSALEGVHTPYDKKWEPDFKNMPVHPAQPASTQTSVTGGGTVPGAQQQLTVPAPPPGVGEHPPMALPQEMTGTVQGQGHPTLPLTAELTKPGVPAGIFKSPEQMAQEHAMAMGLQTQATAGAQMAAPIYQAQPGGGYQAVPVSHAGTIMGPAIPNAMSPNMIGAYGQGDVIPASVATQTGIPLPDGIDPQGWVRVQRNKMGQIVNVVPSVEPSRYAPTSSESKTTDPATGLTTVTKGVRSKQIAGVGGGSKVTAPATPPGVSAPAAKPAVSGSGGSTKQTTIGGQPVPPGTYKLVEDSARNWERSGVVPNTKLAPLAQSYMNDHGMVPHTTQQVGDMQKGFDAAMAEDRRAKMMYGIWQDVQKKPTKENLGSLDAALIAYHMGMTVGAVKGMRSGKDMMKFHTAARSLPEDMKVAFEHWVNGSELSSQQRENFVNLAMESRKSAWEQAVTQARGMGFTRFPDPTPGLPPMKLWQGTMGKQQIDAAAKDHDMSYGDVRKQAVQEGYRIDD